MNLQRKDIKPKFGIMPGMDKPIFKDLADKMKVLAALGAIEESIRLKALEFERVSGKKAKYVIMDETSYIEMTSLDRMAHPHKQKSLSTLEVKYGTVGKFDYMDVIIVHDRGRGIQIGC